MPTTTLRMGSLATWASSALAAAVFAFLDVVDVLLCFVYGFLDGVLEDSPVSCYCHRRTLLDGAESEEGMVSDTLYERRSLCRDALTGLVRRVVVVTRRRRRRKSAGALEKPRSPRWSDCGCASCSEWKRGGDGVDRLHVVVKEQGAAPKAAGSSDGHAVFIHGFTSSSSFWTETVFRESSDECRRLLAVDLLGFGRSPKPGNCLYRLKDHVDAIERSVLVDVTEPPSFHLVSHSMGCIIALALAARHPSWVRSITLVAPPYSPLCEHEPEQSASQAALRRLAGKKLWPPLLFGSAVMSWYEHIGRTVCFVVCKNHLVWERVVKLLARNRDGVDFRLRDLTRHTHHSAWHTMHNVVCGGARVQDRNLDAVEAAGIPVQLVHGDKDPVVPVECSRHLKAKLPRAELRVVRGGDHSTVVLGREKDFAEELRAFWSSAASKSS